jgi:hypothetical protein
LVEEKRVGLGRIESVESVTDIINSTVSEFSATVARLAG